MAVIVAAVVSALGITVVAFVTNAQVPVGSTDRQREEPGPPPVEVTQSDDEVIMGVARDFLRYAAKGKPVEACLMVIDNGGILNPCENDLGSRKDWEVLTKLDPGLTVTGLDRDGDRATIAAKNLNPAPSLQVSIEVVHTRYGSWKVRKLNGRSIEYEGDF